MRERMPESRKGPRGSNGWVSATVLLVVALVAVVAGGPLSTGRAAARHRPAIDTGGSVTAGTGTATFIGMVNPDGLPTTGQFEYGIDPRYRPPGDTDPLYDQSTSIQDVGSGSEFVTITAEVSGLVPNAVYHMRVVATSSGAIEYGPDVTFTTAEDPPPPPPVLGRTENVTPSGSVFLISHNQVPLTEPRQLSVGTEVNTLRGSAKLVSASGVKNRPHTGEFTGGVFKFAQTRTGEGKGLTTVSLVEDAFHGAPSYSSCTAGRAVGGPAHLALSRRVLQTLHARASGPFRTRGRYAAGTVRGTRWSIADRCDGTLISVQSDSVLVQNLITQISVLLHAGQRYLATAPHG